MYIYEPSVGAEIVTKRPSKSVNSKTVAAVQTVARKSPPHTLGSLTSGHKVLSGIFVVITPQAARFTQLPYDIVWEILAYYPAIPNWEVARNQTVLNPKYLQRYLVLRTLSQTCRALRFQCHPHLWEHIQACLLKERGNPGSFYRQVGEALQKQSHIIFSALPEFQPLVRCVPSQLYPFTYSTLEPLFFSTMTVSLTRYQVKKTLPAFVNALEMLPNLHTLRICHAHSQLSTHLKDAFEGHVFPQIMTVVLPSCAHNILRSCPNVTDVTNIEEDGTKLAGAICKECPQVERVTNFNVSTFTLKSMFPTIRCFPDAKLSDPLIIGLARALPKLRSFGLMRVYNVVCPLS